jgi:F420-dependent oxidoreductase-like protein
VVVVELPSPCLVVLVGPAASGKTSWAQANLAAHVVSSDSLRALVGEGEDDLRASTDAFAVLEDIVARRLRRGLTTVVDSLGTDTERRARWRQLAADHGIPCVAVVFDITAAQLRRQNKGRAKRVPDAVLNRQIADWPAVRGAIQGEPFDAIHVVDTSDIGAALVQPDMVRRERGHTTAAPTAAATPDRKLRFGLQIPQFTWPGGPAEMGERLRAVATRAEEIGFDSLWVMDHFRQIPQMGPPWADMLESWTTLGHLAASTTTIRLGTLVSGITYRNVAHLGKIVATLDVLSGGRAICGVGLAWFEDEHRAYGWPFPSRNDRYAVLEDALQLLPRLWGPGGKPFEGRVLRVPDTSCYPRPLQDKLPILVGGSGERRTLKLVARYADACNLFGDPNVVAHKTEVLRRHCADAGRDPADISITHLSTVLVGDDAPQVRQLVEATRPPRVSAERHARSVNAGTVEHHVERVNNYVAAGVDHVIVSVAGLEGPTSLDAMGRLIEAVRREHH